jgi:Tol biopolymer transport system component
LLSFSRDGQTVAYSTYPEDIIWKSSVDGTGRIQLSDATLHPESVDISPDGSQVAFDAPSQEPNVRRAYVVSAQSAGA